MTFLSETLNPLNAKRAIYSLTILIRIFRLGFRVSQSSDRPQSSSCRQKYRTILSVSSKASNPKRPSRKSFPVVVGFNLHARRNPLQSFFRLWALVFFFFLILSDANNVLGLLYNFPPPPFVYNYQISSSNFRVWHLFWKHFVTCQWT